MATTTMYGGPSQEDIAQQRRLAQQLMSSGMSAEPVQHWTQGLARVLQAGVGGMNQDAARQADKDMAAHLSNTMQSGKYDIPTLLSNPLGRPFAFNLAQMNAEQNTPMARARLAQMQQETRQSAELHPSRRSAAEAEAQIAQERAAEAKDPMRVAKNRASIAEQYLPAESRGAFAATGQYTPEPRVTVVPDGGTAIVRNRETGDYQAVQGGATDPETRFKKEFAKKAPEMFNEAGKAFSAAREASNLAADMEAIAPHIISGTWANLTTSAKQFLNTYAPGVNFKDVAPTQLFISLGQKFVGAEGQKYRPLSNADITFIERGLPNVQKDPSSLPLILKAMQSASDREALFRDMEMKALRKGEPPDYDRIVKEVNRLVPSFAQQYGAQLSGGRTGGATAQGGREAAPAQAAPLAEGGTYRWTPQGLQRIDGPQTQAPEQPPIDTSTPAGRAQAARQQRQQAEAARQAEIEAARQQQRDRSTMGQTMFNRQFEADLSAMHPMAFVEKYDAARGQMNAEQIRILNSRIDRLTRGGQ